MAFPASLTSKFSGIAVSVALGVMVMGEPAMANEAEPLKVGVDRAKVVRINQPAETIIIGNPSIVDATVQDSQTLVLTGRSFGVTNLIVLDAKGEPIVDETVVVHAQEAHSVRIYRRLERQTLACAPVCEPTLTIGDTLTTFNGIRDQITDRNKLSAPQQ